MLSFLKLRDVIEVFIKNLNPDDSEDNILVKNQQLFISFWENLCSYLKSKFYNPQGQSMNISNVYQSCKVDQVWKNVLLIKNDLPILWKNFDSQNHEGFFRYRTRN